MLGDVLPVAASQDHRNGSLGAPEFCGQFSVSDASGLVSGANFPDLCFGEPDVRGAFSDQDRGSRFAALRSHIRVIVGVGAKEQVTRVAARWVIAPMANSKPGRVFARLEFVGDAMRQSRPSVVSNDAVATGVPSTEIRPATIKSTASIGSCLEFFGGRWHWAIYPALTRAVQVLTPFERPLFPGIAFPTGGTLVGDIVRIIMHRRFAPVVPCREPRTLPGFFMSNFTTVNGVLR